MDDPLVALMTTPFGPAIAMVAGLVLGLMFYAGLWWTVRHAATFRRPGLSVLASSMLRMAVTLCGIYLVGGDDWARLFMCLAGFLLARVAVTWCTRLPPSVDGGVAL